MHHSKFRYISFFSRNHVSSKYLILLLVSTIFLCCLDEIDLPLPERYQDSLVIQGRMIYGNPTEVRVMVGKVFDFSPNSLRPITVKSVKLFNESNNYIELEKTDPEFYEAFIPMNDPSFEVIPNRQYKLEVVSFDNRTFESSFETLLPVSPITNLTLRIFDKDIIDNLGDFSTRPYFGFFVSGSFTGTGQTEKSRIKFEIERTYKLTDTPLDFDVEPKTCYITETPAVNVVKVLDGNEYFTDEIVDFPVYECQMDYRFAEGCYVTVYQQAMSEGAFTYWDQIAQLIERTGNMFEAPAGKVITNFQNVADPRDEVFGYFYATQQDTMRLYVSPEQAGYPISHCPYTGPPPPGGLCPGHICCDCLQAKISTTTKPEYWVE